MLLYSLSSLFLLLSSSLGAEEEFDIMGWKVGNRQIRCRPGPIKEPRTCRKRTFGGATEAAIGLYLSAGLTVSIPIPELDTEAIFYIPFSMSVRETLNLTSAFGGKELQGRYIKERINVYTKLEGMIGAISNTDGHSCLLRAMCEAGSAPAHGDGLMGEAVNLLLSAGRALVGGVEEEVGEYTEYTTAQEAGMVSGDCSSYNHLCPLSFFDFLTNGINSI